MPSMPAASSSPQVLLKWQQEPLQWDWQAVDLAARTDAEHYATERATEVRETEEMPEKETEEVSSIFRAFGLPEGTVQDVVRAISSDQNRWVDFMMRFELGLEEPDPKRAHFSALTIAISYIVGGLVPLGLPISSCNRSSRRCSCPLL